MSEKNVLWLIMCTCKKKSIVKTFLLGAEKSFILKWPEQDSRQTFEKFVLVKISKIQKKVLKIFCLGPRKVSS